MLAIYDLSKSLQFLADAGLKGPLPNGFARFVSGALLGAGDDIAVRLSSWNKALLRASNSAEIQAPIARYR